MKKRGKVLRQVLSSLFKKPVTTHYPFEKEKSGMPKGFRGKIIFHPSRCIGCKMCMRDCPTGAINIKKIGEKQFEAEIDLGKCIYCAQCVDSCIKKALEYSKDFELASTDRGKLKVILDAEPEKPNAEPEKPTEK
ncbi:MAG: 4Fe-4S dicluster domain-containing protein [Candidatus Omnitrophica bacterium]|nr:4Fe-4S dicluster domain-containing protein [Candidatus Omnitrophota bacterium]MDD5237210.1 4Fe-4S dicluster domain-containing protein [Candidatus Omnitrophota bacterium]MDD5610248.1 4Fe-4S dicluster domain-containing protein [Candidatus Omnitrophota bacterium]